MIVVDECRAWPNGLGGLWCHMMTDDKTAAGLEALHSMAVRIGLKRAWFQDVATHPHYDLRPSKRDLALQHGAEAVEAADLVRRCKWPDYRPGMFQPPATSARELAESLKARLAPHCHRIEIAGSLRRGKEDPGDIDLVCIARYATLPTFDFFGAVASPEAAPLSNEGSAVEAFLIELYGEGEWELDTVLRRNGPRSKRLRHRPSGICCDLAITTRIGWGVMFTLKTGPAEFSHRLVMLAPQKGMKVEGTQLWREHRDGSRTAVPVHEESDLFAALGMRWLEPKDRK